VSAISNPNEEPILTPVQLLWVNLIMDTFAALALATDPPQPSILERKPEPKSARLITLNMWKMIVGQAIYQLVVTLTLSYAGNEILGYETEYEKNQLETLIFNIYVWMQIFNQLKSVVVATCLREPQAYILLATAVSTISLTSSKAFAEICSSLASTSLRLVDR
jgi:Ca2+-transporting ATPase